MISPTSNMTSSTPRLPKTKPRHMMITPLTKVLQKENTDMELVNILKQMAQFTRASGKTIKEMGSEHSQIIKGIHMLENGKMARLTVKVPLPIGIQDLPM